MYQENNPKTMLIWQVTSKMKVFDFLNPGTPSPDIQCRITNQIGQIEIEVEDF